MKLGQHLQVMNQTRNSEKGDRSVKKVKDVSKNGKT